MACPEVIVVRDSVAWMVEAAMEATVEGPSEELTVAMQVEAERAVAEALGTAKTVVEVEALATMEVER